MKITRAKAFKIFSVVVVIGFLLVTVFPFFWILISSLKPEVEIFGKGAYKIIAENPTIQNYKTVIIDRGFLNAIKNSFIVSVITTLYVVIVASMSAYIIARFKFKGKNLLMGLILSVSMFPQMVVVGPIFNLYYKYDLLNSYWISLAFSTITLPMAVWIMVTHFRQVPLALEEAAKIDGCSMWGILWKIIFPIAAPGIFTTAIMTFIGAWNEYLLSYTMNSNVSYHSVPIAISFFRQQFTIFWGEICAAAVIAVVPTLIIVLLFSKQIVAGIARGAVKE